MAKKKKETPEEQIQKAIASIVVDSEYQIAKTNQDRDNIDFDELIDMLDGIRTRKDYEWMSDYSIPELISIVLTMSSQAANQYFQTRDFVEVRLDGETPEDFKKAQAAKKCINKTLNRKDLYYFQKFMRKSNINTLLGRCWSIYWWEQELRKEKRTINKPQVVYDEQGLPLGVQMVPVETEVEVPIVDRFCFDVLDPRNVFTDNKYCYTAQQKDWIIVRDETTYETLKANEKKYGYFNLDKVKEAVKNRNKQTKSDTAKETYSKENELSSDKTPVYYFDIIDRYGKFWVIVEKRDRYGNPIKATPGIDLEGMPEDDAELVEAILTFILIGNEKILIRFEPTSYIDSVGKPYKPLVRGLCYIHPTKDSGLSDGKNMVPLQVAIDDNFNMGFDRVKLATLPTFKGKKYSLEDNSSVYIEPEHVIELENPDDLQELVIRDDISGAMNVNAMLTGKMQQVAATYPTTMGALPDKTSTPATAIAGAEIRTNARANYKSLTFEYTDLVEHYWMILQMTQRFAHDNTLIELLGADAEFFDANANYTYSPVTSAVEAEYNKNRKIQMLDQSIGQSANIIPILPKMVPIIAHMMKKKLLLMGDELADIQPMIEDLSKSQPVQEGQPSNQVPSLAGPSASNQNGMPMSPMEAMARENVMISGGMMPT